MCEASWATYYYKIIHVIDIKYHMLILIVFACLFFRTRGNYFLQLVSPAKLNGKSLLLTIISLQTKLLLVLYWHAPFGVSQLSGAALFVLI